MRKGFELFDGIMGGQWGNPHGPLGWLAARLMEFGNARMNELAIEVLAPVPGERVLEVGFGPGLALERLAELVGSDGFAAGIDPSELMVRRAGRRLRSQIAAGRVELRMGISSAMSYADAAFDGALSVNTIYFWEHPLEDIAEIKRVVQPGGRFVLVFRADAGEAGALTVNGMPQQTSVEDVTGWLRQAGFANVAQHTREVPFGPTRVTGVALAASG